MGRRKRVQDENQLALPFDRQVALYAETSKSILEHAAAAITAEPEMRWSESEMELNIGLAAACKQAIQQSGMSREQALDAANALFGRNGSHAEGHGASEPDAKRAVSIHVFNNYLSKPSECRLPVWLVWAICSVTGSLAPLEHLVNGLGGVVISAYEQKELLLGKLNSNMIEGARLKRALIQQLRAERPQTA